MMPTKKTKTSHPRLYTLPAVKPVSATTSIFTRPRYRENSGRDGSSDAVAREREIARYAELIRSMPSIRAEKVALLREAIKNKTYHVEATEIAEKILSITPEMAKF